MKSTKVINALVLAITGGELQKPTLLVLDPTTGAYNIEIVVTNAPVPLPDIPTHPYVELCSISTNVPDAASLPFAGELSLNRNTKTVKMKLGKDERTFDHSDVYAVNGPNLHLWVNHPRLPAGCSIEVWVNEF